MDDIGWTPRACPEKPKPAKCPDAGLKLAREFHALMGGRPWLGAVIPTSLDGEGLAWLRSQPDGLTVALHGYEHARRLDVDCEFHGLQAEEVKTLLKHGLDVLPGVPVVDFVPPFNAFALPWHQACAELGLRNVWTSPLELGVPPEPVRTRFRTILIHGWLPLYGATNRMVNEQGVLLLDEVKKYLNLGRNAVLTLHLTWEAKPGNWDGTKRLLDLIHDRIISPEDFLRHI